MCNYVQPRAPGLLCLVIQLSGMIRISCPWISSIHVRQNLEPSFVCLEMSHGGALWNHHSSSDGQIPLHLFEMFPIPLPTSWVLTSFWTDSKQCKVSVSLDYIGKKKIPLSLWISRDDMEHGRQISSQKQSWGLKTASEMCSWLGKFCVLDEWRVFHGKWLGMEVGLWLWKELTQLL